MSSNITEFAAKPKAEPREEVTPNLVNHLKSTSSLYLLNMDYFKDAKELYKAPKNDNRFMAVAIAMAKRQEQSGDYGAALAMSEDTADKSAANASAVNNHVVSILNEIKNNPEIRTVEDAKMLVQQVKAANAMDVVVGGRTENYAADALDFAVNGVLESIGKGDAKKGFEALKNGKVSEESVENYGAIAAQKFALTNEKAAELAAATDRNAAFAQKGAELTQAEAMQKYVELQQNYRQLPEALQKSLKELPGPQILNGVSFKDNVQKDDEGSYVTYIYNKDAKEFLQVSYRSDYDVSTTKPAADSRESAEKSKTVTGIKQDITQEKLDSDIKTSDADLMTVKVDRKTGAVINPGFTPTTPFSKS